ncbi:MAG: Asp23/Gls24 family envelope stress response protein [Ruminococcus sp.]|nr:Asp23/Gls24 family envelope stress response protein [Ruminococcus sp.]
MSDVEKNAQGALKVSREVIADIVSGCVKETEGVARIALKNKIVNKLANTKKEESIKITMIGDVISVSFGVIIKNGFNAVKTAETIQENVKNAVASMLGLTVAKVNINIVNVEFAQ